LVLLGCQPIKPTYNKEKIVEAITSLCLAEYNLEPKVWLLGETVWIYIPQPRLITKTVEFDKEILEKINKVMMGASRVVLSMKPRPQFMVMVASDIGEYGIDYTVITWIPDIVKYQLQFISRDEFGRRNVVKIQESVHALADTEGNHIEKGQIKLGDFLAAQIAQRIQAKFTLEKDFKDYFDTEKIEAVFQQDIFNISVIIKPKETSPARISIQKEIAKICAYVMKEYDFKDFLFAKIENSATGEKAEFSRLALKDFLK
jgi:hypothetical protein